MYLQSIKSVKQNAANSVNRSTERKKPTYKAGSLKMNTALEYSTRVVQEGGRRCKKSTLNVLVHLTPLRIPLMNPPIGHIGFGVFIVHSSMIVCVRVKHFWTKMPKKAKILNRCHWFLLLCHVFPGINSSRCCTEIIIWVFHRLVISVRVTSA